MEQNENTSEQGQTKEAFSPEAQFPGPSAPASNQAKETPAHTTQAETVNDKQETDPMEVQKHPHHVMHKKKWTEYLLEFFMLFLAVFLGFLAENFREHQVEKERGKNYVESFYEDLKADTSRIPFYIDFDDVKLTALKNLSTCYDSVSKKLTNSCMLEMIKVSALNRPFKITERTLNQLSNAGGFRLLPGQDADSILAYQNGFNGFEDFQLTAFQQAQDKVRSSFDLLVNFNANVQMFKPDGNRIGLNFDDKDVTNPVLFSSDPALLNQYFNELLLYYRATYNHQKRLLELKEQQGRLIGYFKNRYNFK